MSSACYHQAIHFKFGPFVTSRPIVQELYVVLIKVAPFFPIFGSSEQLFFLQLTPRIVSEKTQIELDSCIATVKLFFMLDNIFTT